MLARITEKTPFDVAVFAVSLNDAKAHLRITHAAEDDLIKSYIHAATQLVANHCQITVLSQALLAKWDCFDKILELRKGPISSVSSVKYKDVNGVEQTLDPASYQFSPRRMRGIVAPVPSAAWPQTDGTMDCVTVEYMAGWAAGEAVTPVIQSIKLVVSHFYEVREPVNIGNIVQKIPFTVESLLQPYCDIGMG